MLYSSTVVHSSTFSCD